MTRERDVAQPAPHQAGPRRLSNKMDKTIVVVTETRVPHPVYKKIVRKSARFKAHDEKNEAEDRRRRAHHGVPSDVARQALAPARDRGASAK